MHLLNLTEDLADRRAWLESQRQQIVSVDKPFRSNNFRRQLRRLGLEEVIVLQVAMAGRAIDPVQFDTARTLGLTTLQTLREPFAC